MKFKEPVKLLLEQDFLFLRTVSVFQTGFLKSFAFKSKQIVFSLFHRHLSLIICILLLHRVEKINSSGSGFFSPHVKHMVFGQFVQLDLSELILSNF